MDPNPAQLILLIPLYKFCKTFESLLKTTQNASKPADSKTHTSYREAALLPTFSVMIPTYEDRTRFLKALDSVLCQDPGKDDMQIAIVDDASKSVNVSEIINNDSRLRDRVEVYRSEQNRGLAGNWNHAISLARGHFVHILHQDDYVLPGFYAAMEKGLSRSDEVGMAYCRSKIVDGLDNTLKTCSRERWFSGILNHSWLSRISIRQRIQTPSVVVRRDVYQAVGDYRQDLCFALDWEMWVRIATNTTNILTQTRGSRRQIW